jgi:hypothetical protein
MRVNRAGLFVWSATGDIVTSGWEFDMEGAPPPTPTDVLACILNHIAKGGGLHATAPADPVAAQGLADDVIERARKAGL